MLPPPSTRRRHEVTVTQAGVLRDQNCGGSQMGGPDSPPDDLVVRSIPLLEIGSRISAAAVRAVFVPILSHLALHPTHTRTLVSLLVLSPLPRRLSPPDSRYRFPAHPISRLYLILVSPTIAPGDAILRSIMRGGAFASAAI